jgi:cholesterol oxidase
VGLGAQPPRSDSVPGPCSTAMIDLRKPGAPAESLVMEDGAIPGALAPLLAPFFTLESKVFGDGSKQTLGERVRGTARELVSDVLGAYSGAVNNTLFFLAMAHDQSQGRLFLENDRLRASYSGLGNEPQFQAASNVLDRLSHALAGTYVKNPIWNALTHHNTVTGHPLGGCPIADRAEDGVVNEKGQVFCVDAGAEVHTGLYVMDGSIVPTALGVNPLMTISALAERCCDQLVNAGAPRAG